MPTQKRLYIRVIPDKYLPALKEYKNRGEDRSITRKFVLNYFYEFLIDNVIPPTIQ